MNKDHSVKPDCKPKADGCKPSILSELLGCPFCGNKYIGIEKIPPEGKTIWWRAMCQNCGARSQMAGTRETSIKNWNERAI